MTKKKQKSVICLSGTKGWQDKLQNVYNDSVEFAAYDEIYNLSKRLGYEDSTQAWDDNPLIQGSTQPNDFRNVALLDEAKRLNDMYTQETGDNTLDLTYFYDKLMIDENGEIVNEDDF